MTPLDPPPRTFRDLLVAAADRAKDIRRANGLPTNDLPDVWAPPKNRGCEAPRTGKGRGNRHGRPPVAVECVETGRRFASLALAAEWLRSTPGRELAGSGNIHNAMTKGGRAYGYHWRATKTGGAA